MMRRTRLPMMMAILLIPLAAAFSCEPCLHVLSVRETAAQSDVVLVGRRMDSANPGEKPNFLRIKAVNVLRGEIASPVLKVHAWYGMCAYGVTELDHTPQVLFLKKEGQEFTTVANGCGVKTLPLVDFQVVVEGQRMSLAEFKAKVLSL